MAELEDPLPWTVERRLEFIDFRLMWEGQIRRGDLKDSFDISIQQASTDLAKYQSLAPENLIYDTTRKAYVATAGFKPHFLRVSADRLLLQFRALFNGLISRRDTSIGVMPDLGVVPEVRRPIDNNRLRLILRAVRSQSELDIRYQSFTREECSQRTIVPHALAFDGFRWHVRAWCKASLQFKDFVISRMIELGPLRGGQVDPAHDQEWQQEFTLCLAPNPKLAPSQRKVVELDYAMTKGVREVKTTIALAFYLIRQLNLDLDPDLMPPERQQVVLTNKHEYDEARAAAVAASKRMTRQAEAHP